MLTNTTLSFEQGVKMIIFKNLQKMHQTLGKTSKI